MRRSKSSESLALLSIVLSASWPGPALALPPLTPGHPFVAPVFGAAHRIENVAVYPITLGQQEEVGPVMTLEEAMSQGKAEVREVGAAQGVNEPAVQLRGRESEHVQNAAPSPAGASVNTLVIENKGDRPIFVLAGTVVKGGNQDRQIGQDFFVDAGKTVPVDAFCVEHGRWSGDRAGRQTAGQFEAAATLATSKVRVAGQHKKDQSEVWSEVAEANKANGKSAASGTLLATLDAGDIAARADQLSQQLDAALAEAPPEALVGFAYAVDGKVRGVRWFTNHRLFAMYRSKLVRTAAVDALTSAAETKAAGAASFAGVWPSAADVEAFVSEVEARAVKETRDTEAGNANEYKESDRAFGAKAVLKAKGEGKAKPLSFDFLAK